MTTSDIVKLESVASQLYGPNPTKEITEFCSTLQNTFLSHPENLNLLYDAFCKYNNPHLQFWIINLLVESIKQNANQVNQSIRDFIMIILSSNLKIIYSENFISNKFCYLVIMWIKFTYPEANQNFWEEVIQMIISAQEQSDKMNKVNVFLDLLCTFDEELIQFRYTYSEFEGEQSNKIKNYIRKNSINEIINVIYQILLNAENLDRKIIAKSIKVVSQLINWNLMQNCMNVIQLILGNMIVNGKFIGECLAVVNAIVKKGMDTEIKAQTLGSFGINSIIENLIKNPSIKNQELEILAEIVNRIGLFLIDVFTDIQCKIEENQNLNNNSNINQIKEHINETSEQMIIYFKYIIGIFNHKQFDFKTGMEFLDFLSSVISYFRGNNNILLQNEKLLEEFNKVFILLETSLKIPKMLYSFEDNLFECQEDDFFSYRRECAILYYKIFNINSFKEQMLYSIIQKSKNANDKYEIEHLLFLISSIQQSIHNVELKDINISSLFNQILTLLFSLPFTEQKSDYILVEYYDTVLKVIQHILPNQQALEFLFQLFLNERGIMHHKIEIGEKILLYFDKFVIKTKTQLNKITIIDDIISKIMKIIISIKDSHNFLLLSKYANLFHCLAMIISIGNDIEKQKHYYENVLKILLELSNQIQNDIDKFCVIGYCIIQFINESKDNDIKILCYNFFNVFFNEYCSKMLLHAQNSKILILINSLLQKSLIILGSQSIIFIEGYFMQIYKYINIDNFDEIIKLMQNFINVTKKESIKFIQKIFYFLYQYVSSIQLPNDNISDYNKNVLSIYMNFTRFNYSICREIPEVFFAENGIENLDLLQFFKFLFSSASTVIDNQIRRTIIKTIKEFSLFFNKNSQLLIDSTNQTFNVILTLVLDGTFSVFKKLNVNEPIDSSTFIEISQIHLYISGFKEFYSSYLLKYVNQNEAENIYAILLEINPKKIQSNRNLVNAFKVRIYVYNFLF